MIPIQQILKQVMDRVSLLEARVYRITQGSSIRMDGSSVGLLPTHNHKGTSEGGTIDHGDLTDLVADDHTQYILKSLLAAKGDILVRNGAGNVVKLSVSGHNGYVLTEDSAVAEGIKWDTGGGGMGGADLLTDGLGNLIFANGDTIAVLTI